LLLDPEKWHNKTSGIEKNVKYFTNEETVYTTETIEVNGSSFFFYIYISGPVSILLTENAIKFGLKVTDGSVFFNMGKLTSDYRVVKDYQAIERSITLLSNSEASIISLQSEMHGFIETIPLLKVNAKDLQNKLSDTFTKKFRP
jgi:hypothetical protein